MRATILSTKLYIPPSRPDRVVRPRLLQKLDDSLKRGCKLSLVSAPAGFGKTTLVVEWISAIKRGKDPIKTAWYSLDASDNDLGVFLRYLIAALQTCEAGLGEVTNQLLDNSTASPIDGLLLPLINDLAGLSSRLILVLDDYHLIQQQAVHQAIAFLIEHQPPGVQLVITTRQDPLLPLGRWRARGQLTDIRLKELRFSAQESAEFLEKGLGFSLRASDVAALEARTEGWIAGLQLASVSLLQSSSAVNSESITSFIHSFTGNDRYLMDYLMDEVLSRQPEGIQQFLLRTSVLERFNAGLCDFINQPAAPEFEAPAADRSTQQPFEPQFASSVSSLDYLDRSNLFLIPLDNRREWYRYHHLFAELLQHRLKISMGKTMTAELKQRASQWFDGNGLPEEAVRYAQEAADWNLSRDLILKYGPILLQGGDTVTVLRWVKGMPDPVLRQNAALCRYYGYLLGVTGKLDLGGEYLAHAEHNFGDDPFHIGSTLAFASYIACYRGEFEKEIEQARRALSLLPPDDHWLRGIAAISLGLGLCHIKDPQGCETAMHAAYEAGQRSGTIRTCFFALAYLGRMTVLRLDFRQAEIYYQQAVHYWTGDKPYGGSDLAFLDLAQIYYEKNEFDQAMSFVEQGLEANLRGGSIEMRSYGYRQAARVYQLRGQAETSQEYLQKGLKLGADFNLSPLTESLDAAMEIEMALTVGNLQKAELAAARLKYATGLYPFNFFPEMARAHYLIVRGLKAEALDLLEPAIHLAEQPGWEYPRLQMRCLQALAEDDPHKASQFLSEGLALAEPCGLMRCFIDLGSPMAELLRRQRQDLPALQRAFAGEILAAFERELNLQSVSPQVSRSQRSETGLVETLSERELEVLRLLADGLSNAEIAQRLYLSPNTLKAHTQNIYSKMDVHSRIQVVNKARELGLIV